VLKIELMNSEYELLIPKNSDGRLRTCNKFFRADLGALAGVLGLGPNGSGAQGILVQIKYKGTVYDYCCPSPLPGVVASDADLESSLMERRDEIIELFKEARQQGRLA
jgi:hypothetical protein